MTVTLVSFLIAITFSGSIATNFTSFVGPLVVGIIFLIIFIIVEKRVKAPLINLKLVFHPVIFTGNIMMLMFGIVQYFIITGIPQLGSAPPPSGLGLDPTHTGLLQLAFGLSMMIFGPVFGLLIGKRKGLNTKLLVPGILISAISFLLLTLFHSTSQAVNGGLFLFGIAGALLPLTLNNTNISFTPKEYTGISSGSNKYDENCRGCYRSSHGNRNSIVHYNIRYCQRYKKVPILVQKHLTLCLVLGL